MSDKNTPHTFVLLDYEYWTDEGAQERRRRGMKDLPPILTQIGAIKVTLDAKMTEVSALNCLVIPRDLKGNQIQLSPFYERLTNSTNAQFTEQGKELADAMATLKAFIGDDLVFSYGPDDLSSSALTCYIFGVEHAYHHAQSRDIRKVFHKAGIAEASLMQVSSGNIASHFGIPSPEDHHTHNALDDVRSLARLLRHLAAEGALDLAWLQPELNRAPWGEGDILHV